MTQSNLTDRQPEWLFPTQVFDGERLRADTAIKLNNNRVEHITARASVSEPGLELKGIVSPGLFDIQVNGGGNVLFNTQPTENGAYTIAGAHRKFGSSWILPTVITDAPEVLDAAADAICACNGKRGVAGIHIEGPHISGDRAGTHSTEHIRPLDNRTITVLRKLRGNGVPTLITVAPEAVSVSQIKNLVSIGVVVSLGHSNAKVDKIRPCLDAGAMLFTHLYNAMSPMTGRAPGMVGTAINSEVYTSIIADGIHVCADMIQLAINARPRADRMIAVSDAMPTVGGDPEFSLYGQTIRLDNGRLINKSGSLAGAHITLAQSLQYLKTHTTLSMEDCLRMCITHPASLMGLPHLAQLQSMSLDDCVLIPANIEQTGLLASRLA